MNRVAPYLTIDADSHLGMDLGLWDRYLAPEFRDHPLRPRYTREHGVTYFEVGRLCFPPKIALPYITPSGQAPGPRGGVDADFRVTDFMDPEGIDRGMQMPGRTLGVSYVGDPELGTAQAQAWNSWLYDFCRHHPTRLFGYGVVNAADPAAAVREMRRGVNELGFPAIYINPAVIGGGPDDYHILCDEHYFPIYEEAVRLGVGVAIHAFSDPFVEGHEYNWPKPPNLLWSDINGFPFQGMQQLSNLVLGGVCETFPDLKIAIFEAGLGWVPLLIDRIHERMEKFKQSVKHFAPKLRLRPEEYIQRQIFFGFEPEDPFVPDFIRWTKAPDRLLFSADYPHLDYQPGQLAEFLEREDVSDDHKRLALRDNPLAFGRWDRTAMPAIVEETTVNGVNGHANGTANAARDENAYADFFAALRGRGIY